MADTRDLYETDFYAWTQEQAVRLRARASFDNRGDIDWKNAAEEIESLGRSERNEIRSRLLVVLIHLLKWRFQPTERSSGWRGTLVEQRSRLEDALDENPSLRSFPVSVLAREYRIAQARAGDETGLTEKAFPTECPFTIEEILDPDFYPEPQ